MSFSKQMADSNNNNNLDHNTTNNTNNNNDNNSDNDNNKNGQESSLRSLNLDNENPESSLSDSDLDRLSFDSFAHTVETGLAAQTTRRSIKLDHLRRTNDDNRVQLRELDPEQPKLEKGMIAGTTWDPSLGMDRDSFDKMKQKKKVTFSKETLAAYKSKQQNNEKNKGSHPGCSQLNQLGHNKEHNNNQQAWQNRPSMMQQQPATASEKELEHMQCNAGSFSEDDSFEEEDRALGSFEAQPQATTSLPACRFPEQNNNNSILGQDLNNKTAWGILIDTGAAMSLAPVSFAPEAELSPLESTLQLQNLEGKAITAYGRKTVDFRGSQLSFSVSFVIADVEHVSLGMDIFVKEQLSMIRSRNNEIHLVNKAGAKTQLQQRGHGHFLPCPRVNLNFLGFLFYAAVLGRIRFRQN